MVNQSTLEASFLWWWGTLGADSPEPVHEYTFAKQIKRRWRFDFAWPDHMVAVEMDGLPHGSVKSRHTTRMGFIGDLAKQNAAVLLGWSVLRYTSMDLKDRPDEMVGEVQGLLRLADGRKRKRRRPISAKAKRAADL